MSDLFPNIGRHVDDLRSCARWSRTSPSTPLPTTSSTPGTDYRVVRAGRLGHVWPGQRVPGPARFRRPHGGLIPPGGLDCFNSGFLPASFQGSLFRPDRVPSRTSTDRAKTAVQQRKLALLRKLDRAVVDRLGHDDKLEVGHRQLRAGLPHAIGRPRPREPRQRIAGHPGSLWRGCFVPVLPRFSAASA